MGQKAHSGVAGGVGDQFYDTVRKVDFMGVMDELIKNIFH